MYAVNNYKTSQKWKPLQLSNPYDLFSFHYDLFSQLNIKPITDKNFFWTSFLEEPNIQMLLKISHKVEVSDSRDLAI